MTDERAGPLLRFIRRLAADHPAGPLTDGALLTRFLAGGDEAAFETLLRRHGPMVLAVCRGVLGSEHDAEDAFQATFLVLARRAASIRRPEAVGDWLHGVAYRVALRAGVERAERRRRERQGGERAARARAAQEDRTEAEPALHEEISRLPTKYRLPVVLHYLEGKSTDEVARQLGWPAGTVKVRLLRAREMLHRRLTRQGLGTGAVVATLTQEAGAAVPAALSHATREAVLHGAAGKVLAAGAVSARVAALTEGVLQAMFLTKLIKTAAAAVLAVGVLGGGTGLLLYRTHAVEPAPEKKQEAAKPAPKAESKLPALLKARVEAARTEVEARMKEFEAGRGTLELLYASSRRLLQAERELTEKKADQDAALQAHFERMKNVEEINKDRFEAGRIAIQDYAVSQYWRLEAEIGLERTKQK
jgi:RNA polymerase sigma factor (sigma-70 family)